MKSKESKSYVYKYTEDPMTDEMQPNWDRESLNNEFVNILYEITKNNFYNKFEIGFRVQSSFFTEFTVSIQPNFNDYIYFEKSKACIFLNFKFGKVY